MAIRELEDCCLEKQQYNSKINMHKIIMRLCLIILLSFLTVSFELPNGAEVEAPPSTSDADYSDWYDVLYKTSPVIPMFKSNEKVYFIGKYFRINFLEAQLYCKIMHMNLVTISSKEENEDIYKILQKNGITGDFWTSGTKTLDGKTWMWMSIAKPVRYVNWRSGQPSEKNEHCIQIIRTSTDLIWKSRNCNCRSFFICEKPLRETVLYISKKQEPGIRKYYRTYFD